MSNFIDLLSSVTLANKNQREKELWDVEGVLKDRLNQKFKFDLRPIKDNVKIGSFKSKADKMVFDMKNEYVIVDLEELNKHIKELGLLYIKIILKV